MLAALEKLSQRKLSGQVYKLDISLDNSSWEVSAFALDRFLFFLLSAPLVHIFLTEKNVLKAKGLGNL